MYDAAQLFLKKASYIHQRTPQMQITIEIPDDIAHQLANTPDQLSRRALESGV